MEYSLRENYPGRGTLLSADLAEIGIQKVRRLFR